MQRKARVVETKFKKSGKINSKDRQLIDLILINNTKENDSANPLSDDDTRYLQKVSSGEQKNSSIYLAQLLEKYIEKKEGDDGRSVMTAKTANVRRVEEMAKKKMSGDEVADSIKRKPHKVESIIKMLDPLEASEFMAGL